jgi:hypothetical protein
MNRRLIPLLFVLILLLITQARSSIGNSGPYSFPDLGNMLFFFASPTSGPQDLTLGYALITPKVTLPSTSPAPAGFEILRYRADGVWVSWASMPLSAAVSSGRTYAEVNGPVTTGAAFVNPTKAPITISYYFTNNATGSDFGAGTLTLDAGTQMAAFFNAAPFNISTTFRGTFTFSASDGVGAGSIRGYTNERNEFLWSAQTIIPLNQPSTAPLVMAQFADGGGWKTSVELVNAADQPISGSVRFYSEGSGTTAATPLSIVANGQTASAFPFSIAPHASANFDTSGLGSTVQVGSVVVTPDVGTKSPAGQVVFALVNNGATVTQAGVAAQPASTAARVYVQGFYPTGSYIGSPESGESGVAITNTATTATTVTAELFDSNGVTTGLRTTFSLPPLGHMARLLHELFPGVTGLSSAPMPPTFHGVVRFTSTSAPLEVTGLLTFYNERDDFLITASPATDENAAASTATLLMFPDIALLGGTPVPSGTPLNGFSMELVLFSGGLGQAGSGGLSFYTQAGLPLNVFNTGP